MSDTVQMDHIPMCDLHKMDTRSPQLIEAVYDAKMLEGPWAYLCQSCYDLHGVGLGLGKGQRLILSMKAAQ